MYFRHTISFMPILVALKFLVVVGTMTAILFRVAMVTTSIICLHTQKNLHVYIPILVFYQKNAQYINDM